ncbi:T9SS type B sorting domain-containing protein [Pedobacter duraquae]|uniref:Gliding motility-associated-like protein n=1 Tax=Pedobacter duraquae TaxID=425511 RepID=A0A4R6ILI1_9SPHI|nr:gliding motility-associated C-terminal domain-containing protein [Pedobacter duraquae]TDO22999.1 gliding motility-associated-like protein [Pedobacter duraquae]
MPFKTLQIILCCMLGFSLSIQAQIVCTGSLGDPVVNIDFGRGTANYGPSLNSNTNYRYKDSGKPDDGDYAIVKSTNGMHVGDWHQITNHTPDDPNGYMMLVNASTNPGIFYETSVSQLCPNTTYEFSAWAINILTYSGKKPNLIFSILGSDGKTELVTPYATGDIPEGTASDWKKYGFLFTTPSNVSDVIIRITNAGPGGIGNDLALDDITFRACGPTIVPKFSNTSANSTAICEGDNYSVTLSAAVSAGYNAPSFQWQRNTGTSWTDLPGQNATTYTTSFTNAIAGNYKYRLAVAEGNNINSANCRILSPELNVLVNPNLPPVISGSGSVCLNETILLTVPEGKAYSWTGPNNFSANTRAISIPFATYAMSGTYRVTYTSLTDCINSNTTQLTVEVPPAPQVSSNVEICAGTATELKASGGSSYIWTPTTGLSNPNVANPIASPSATTTYSVAISNGLCTATRQVKVTVIKNATADAGTDQKMIQGQSIQLHGKLSGDNLTYYWSPADYLDDPTKLNPIASPVKDIIYTLNVISANCVSAADQVFIRVFQKLNIPNTFSPNNDNVNDTWEIEALETYPEATIKVFNRNGETVYTGTSKSAPWNGKYNGQILPAGAYYYIITLNSDIKNISGWLMIVR